MAPKDVVHRGEYLSRKICGLNGAPIWSMELTNAIARADPVALEVVWNLCGHYGRLPSEKSRGSDDDRCVHSNNIGVCGVYHASDNRIHRWYVGLESELSQ